MKTAAALLCMLIFQYGDVPADPSEGLDYRRPIKNLVDRPTLAGPVRASVRGMRSFTRPGKVFGNPRQGIETTTFTIRGRLRHVQLQNDGDIHIEISDPRNPREWMVTEVPLPEANPEHTVEWRAIRQELECHHPGEIVTITGVGFFDGPHGGAPTGIELHPVLRMEFER